jgi:hypothetical protein
MDAKQQVTTWIEKSSDMAGHLFDIHKDHNWDLGGGIANSTWHALLLRTLHF